MSYPIQPLSTAMHLLTDYEANGSFGDAKQNVQVSDGEGYAWYVRATDLEKNLAPSKRRYVDQHSYDWLTKTALLGGELLLAKRGEIGKIYLFPHDKGLATTAPNLYLLKIDESKATPYFLYSYFKTFKGQKALKRINASATIGALYKDDVKKLKIPLPDLPTQRRIAAILQTWDRAIQLAEQQLADLQERKRGLMQLLLTGKKRLPEFEGTTKWVKIEFDELAYRVKERFNPKQDSSTLECVELEHLSQNSGVRLGSIKADEISSMKTIYSSNDILFGKLRPYLNKFWLATNEGMCSTEIWALRPTNFELITSNYLYLLVQSERFQNAVNQTSGSKMPRADWAVLSKDIFSIPPTLEEQESIFDLIDLNDQHQSSISNELNSLRLQKRGLMQRLLEGEVEVGEELDEYVHYKTA